MSTIVNAFARAGIYPVNGDMVKNGGTLDPAKLHRESSDSSQVWVCLNLTHLKGQTLPHELHLRH